MQVSRSLRAFIENPLRAHASKASLRLQKELFGGTDDTGVDDSLMNILGQMRFLHRDGSEIFWWVKSPSCSLNWSVWWKLNGLASHMAGMFFFFLVGGSGVVDIPGSIYRSFSIISLAAMLFLITLCLPKICSLRWFGERFTAGLSRTLFTVSLQLMVRITGFSNCTASCDCQQYVIKIHTARL